MSKLPNEEERTRFLQLCLQNKKKWLESPVDAKNSEFWKSIADAFKTIEGHAVFARPSQKNLPGAPVVVSTIRYFAPTSTPIKPTTLRLTTTALRAELATQAKKEMTILCRERRKNRHGKNNGSNRTRLQVAKDDAVAVWMASDLVQKIADFKNQLTESLGGPAVRAIQRQVEDAAAVAIPGDDREVFEKNVLSLFAPPVVEAMEHYIASLKTAPPRARQETVSDDEESEGDDIAIVQSIERQETQEADDTDEAEEDNNHSSQESLIRENDIPPAQCRPIRRAKRKDPSYSPIVTRGRAGLLSLEEQYRRKKQARMQLRSSMNQAAHLPTPPTSQPAAPPEGHQRMEEEEEVEEEEEEEENNSAASESLPHHAAQAAGVASSPPPREDIMNMRFSEFLDDSDLDLPVPAPSSSNPPQLHSVSSPPSARDSRPPTPTAVSRPPSPNRSSRSPTYSPPLHIRSSPRGQPPSTILGTRSSMPEQTPRPDLRHTTATPARSESGLFVPQIITPVPAPRPWEMHEQQKREETNPPLSEIASRGKPSKTNATMRPPRQPTTAAERQKSSTAASEPRASRYSSGAAQTILVLAGGSSVSENGPHRATRRGNQQREPYSTPRQPEDHGGSTTAAAVEANVRPAVKKPKKAQEKKADGKKQKGKEKGKGKEVEKEADEGNRPEPAAVAARSEYALPQRFANSVKPRSAKYIGAPSLAVSVENLRRRQVTSILPPNNPVLQRSAPAAATTTTASNPAPVAKGCYRGQDRPAIPSSSQSRASRFPIRTSRDKSKFDIYDIEAYTPPPDEHTRKLQQARQSSASLPFAGTHIHFGEDGDVVEMGSSTVGAAATTGSQASSNTLSAQSASQHAAETDETCSSRPGSSSKQRKRRHSTVTRCEALSRQSSTAASLANSEPSCEGWQEGSSSPAKRRKGHRGKSNRESSTAAPSSPAVPSFTPVEHQEESLREERRKQRHNTVSRRDSGVLLSSAPQPGRFETPEEWKQDATTSVVEQRKRPHLRAVSRTYSPVPPFVSSPNRELAPRNQERQTSGDTRDNKSSPGLTAPSAAHLPRRPPSPLYPSYYHPPPSHRFSSSMTMPIAMSRDEQRSTRHASSSTASRRPDKVITTPRTNNKQMTDQGRVAESPHSRIIQVFHAAMANDTTGQGAKKAPPNSRAKRAELEARLEEAKQEILSNYRFSSSTPANPQ